MGVNLAGNHLKLMWIWLEISCQNRCEFGSQLFEADMNLIGDQVKWM